MRLFLVCFMLCCWISAAFGGVFSSKRVFILSTWNIGHFSNGGKNNSAIEAANYDRKIDEYRQLIYEDMVPDVICLNEFSVVFGRDRNGKDRSAANVLFDGYKTQVIGDQRWYSCNALFSNCRLRHIRLNDFDCCQPLLKNNPKANQYYYITADLYIGWKKIKMVCVHLYPWDEGIRQMQMQELILKYKDGKRVLMCGDWNSSDFSMYKDAGYILANDGSFKTFPSKSYPLDNIIVKGLRISDVRMIKTDLSDHYPLVCTVFVE